MKIKVSNVNTPNWKDVNVKSHIPAELEKLSELARNIWWSWNYEATELFRDLDPALWKEVGQNPVLLLERMSYAKLEALANDKVILRRLDAVYSKFRNYMDVEPDKKRPSVAYFSMEYGLTHVLKIYSGGLGVLAGDYLKEASDSNVDMCGVGFLYRYGYFTQTLSMDGQQIANYEAQNFGQLPIDRVLDENGQQVIVDVPYLDYYVHAYVWRVNVGRISLYLVRPPHHPPAVWWRLGEPSEAGNPAGYRRYPDAEEAGHQERYLSLQRGTRRPYQRAAHLRLCG